MENNGRTGINRNCRHHMHAADSVTGRSSEKVPGWKHLQKMCKKTHRKDGSFLLPKQPQIKNRAVRFLYYYSVYVKHSKITLFKYSLPKNWPKADAKVQTKIITAKFLKKFFRRKTKIFLEFDKYQEKEIFPIIIIYNARANFAHFALLVQGKSDSLHCRD